MRVIGYLLLTIGMVMFALGLVNHFAGHPDQLAHPSTILARAGVILTIYAHPARHSAHHDRPHACYCGQ